MAAKKPAIPAVHLLLDAEALARLKNHPKGGRSREIIDALDTEQRRINQAHVDHNALQRAKAQKPRRSVRPEDRDPPSDSGRITRKLVARVVRQHPSETPPEDLIPHINAAIEDNGSNPIGDKWAKELIRQVRRAGR